MRSMIRSLYQIANKSFIVQLMEFHLLRKLTKPGAIALYYSRFGNFGDELNDDLMRFLNISYRHSRPYVANLCCIGSNLQQFTSGTGKKLSDSHVLNVLGSGFISPNKGSHESFCFDMRIYALRGELSKIRCEKILGYKLENVTLGDPGLLVKDIFKPFKIRKKYDVGIILHMVDKNNALLQKIKLEKHKVTYIDIELEPKLFVKRVAECDFILSSAMHGLICADSLGIPNKHIMVSNSVVGGTYKFKDYYSVFNGFEYDPICLADQIVTDNDIKTYKNSYTINRSDVKKIRKKLIEAFKQYMKDNKL